MKNKAQRPLGGWTGVMLKTVAYFFTAIFLGFALLLFGSDAHYINITALNQAIGSAYVHHALWMSLWTSAACTAISLLFAIPVGYTLSRYRLPLHVLADTIVDLPIVFPPLVAGMTLLVFFTQTAIGRWIESTGLEFIFQPRGIVLCQLVVSSSFVVRSAKIAFDEVDRRYENVALTLGSGPWGSFFRVTLPLARRGIMAGAILTWARAFGLFGPLMIFVGSFRGRTEVLSTTIFLEQSVGNLELALAIALLLVGMGAVFLIALRLVGSNAFLKVQS